MISLQPLQTINPCRFSVVTSTAEGDRVIMGIILRSHLMVLLSSGRAFQPSPFPSEVRPFTAVPEFHLV